MALENSPPLSSNNIPITDTKESIIESGNNLDDEKRGNGDLQDLEHGSTTKRGFRKRLGASDISVGGRIAPVLPHLRNYDFGSEDSGSDILGKQIELEAGNGIQYRTCSWPKTAALLFSEYICLAIMSFPYSYSVLGLVPGLILTVVVAALVLYTSMVVWEFCLRHPEVR